MKAAGYTITRHAWERMSKRGITVEVLLDIISHPSITYASAKFPGQMRYVKGDYVVCVDTARMTIPTLFFNGRLDPTWEG